jgi:F-type H+-transporting ATPase subunit a
MAGEAKSIFYQPVNAVWDGVVRMSGLEDRLGQTDVPDHVVMALFVVALCAGLFIPFSRRLRRDDPGPFQQSVELAIGALRDMIDEIVGHGASKRYLYIIGGFATFIFLSNMSGALFFLQPPTQNVNTTFALALTACGYYHVMGLRRHGLAYFKQFLGPMPALFLLFIPLEIIQHAARVISLALRLFGNIFGEHLAFSVFVGLVPFLLPLPMMALGVFGATLQTFIFVILTVVYIAGAEAEEH